MFLDEVLYFDEVFRLFFCVCVCGACFDNGKTFNCPHLYTMHIIPWRAISKWFQINPHNLKIIIYPAWKMFLHRYGFIVCVCVRCMCDKIVSNGPTLAELLFFVCLSHHISLSVCNLHNSFASELKWTGPFPLLLLLGIQRRLIWHKFQLYDINLIINTHFMQQIEEFVLFLAFFFSFKTFFCHQ